MAKHPERALSAARIRNLKAGRYADGNGLYLFCEPSGAKRWVLRTVIKGKRTEIGLGSARLISLAEAREEAARLRKLARRGGDPLAEKRAARRPTPTFEEAARRVHEAIAPTFRNPKHRAQWISSLEAYAFPVFGSRSVDAITAADVLAALSPIWISKPETARRVRQRLRAVFDWAKAAGFRSGDNPVDGIARALPKIAPRKNHFAALPYAEVPGFIQALRASRSGELVKLAFEFLILTAARTGEVLRATWDEINLDDAVWTIPAHRMKARHEHRVPLSSRCMEILRRARELAGGSLFVFPGRSPERPLSNMAFLMALRRLGCAVTTAHGFRSSFRDWAEERTAFKRSAIEAALAHQVADKVEGAYLRTTLPEERRRLMDAWAAFATAAPKVKVVRIREA